MKRWFGKRQNLTKGTSSAMLLSVLIHVGLFLLAGALVVFTVVKKEEQVFEPPKTVERPKMKLKKPKVKIKKSSKPKPTARIKTTSKLATMPDIQLPGMGGLGEGLGDGFGDGLSLLPDFDTVSIFGGNQSIGNDFDVAIYDFKRRRDGSNPSVAMSPSDHLQFKESVERFIKSGWNPSSIGRFYQSPRKLYTPMIMIPPVNSAMGPWAFGEREMYPYQYMLHYKGQLVHKDGIRFRFVVMGDNFLLIRLDGKVVMDFGNQFQHAHRAKLCKRLSYHLGHWYAYASDWIDLDPGIPMEMEVICGDYKGGLFAAMIAVEVEGVDYPRAPMPQGNPVLPIFKTSNLTVDQVDAVYEFMWEGHLMVTNGPVFNDYDTASSSSPAYIPAESEPTPPAAEEPALRRWTLSSGTGINAEYVTIIGGKVVLKKAGGRVVKVPMSEFSEKDLNLLELLNPPELTIDFKKDTAQFTVLHNPTSGMVLPTAQEFAGSVVIRQRDMKAYALPMRVEMYVVLDEFDGDNYILMDRQIETFSLTPENGRSFELHGEKKILRKYENYGGDLRGEKYKGYMILVYDERGEIIAQNLSHDWLLDIRDKLLTFPVGRHFNRQGERVHPPRPRFNDRFR